MWMKLFALLVTFACGSASERHKTAAVLTDESKRILDIFDFSNFDKQEALSYIDRQRYENLIRGKRSKWNLRKSFSKPNLKRNDGWLFGEWKRGNRTSVEVAKLELQSLAPSGVSEKCDDVFDGYNKNYELAKKSSNHQLENNPNKDDNLLEGGGFNKKNQASIFEIYDNNETKYLVRKKKDTESEKSRYKLNESNTELSTEEHEDTLDDDEEYDDEEDRRKRKRKKKRKRRRYWGKWSEWSPCSVTCGKGRRIRSRKCIAEICPAGEIEMGEKTCQLPACSLLDKLFSLFK